MTNRSIILPAGAVWIHRLIAVVAVGGGASGLMSLGVSAAGFQRPSEFVYGALFAVAYSFGLWCGIRVLETGILTKSGLRLYFWAQVPVLQTGLLAYFFAGLGSVTLLIRSDSPLSIIYGAGGGFTLATMKQPSELAFGINFVPVIMLMAIELASRVRHSADSGQPT